MKWLREKTADENMLPVVTLGVIIESSDINIEISNTWHKSAEEVLQIPASLP